MFETLSKALATVKETVSGINKETELVASTSASVDRTVARVVSAAEQAVVATQKGASEVQAAFAKFMDGVKSTNPQQEEAGQSSAPDLANTIKQERVAMFAANPSGPASGRGENDWRDRFSNRGGYQQEPDTAPATSSAP